MLDVTGAGAGEQPGAPPELEIETSSLFLDFDGTLVELADRPDRVAVDAALCALMAAAARRLNGRLAVVSGRPAGEIARLFRRDFGQNGAPGDFLIVGSHGLELRRPGGRIEAPARPTAVDTVRAAMADFAATHDGVLLEDKPLGAALHYRMAPALEGEAVALAHGLAARHGLHFQPGKMMAEVRATGADKGAAIAALADEAPFAGTRPVFLGDDLTDEPGFVAAAAAGGYGVLVGPARASAARYRLASVAATRAWLAEAMAAA